MGRPKGPKKVHRYTVEFKIQADNLVLGAALWGVVAALAVAIPGALGRSTATEQ